MQAAYMTDFGGPEVFTFGELDTPPVRPAHVLVRVDAAGLNYYDTLVRRGAVSREIPLPHVPGSDIVGRVEAVGDGVERFAPGDAVIVAPGFPVDEADWSTGKESFARSYYPGGTFNQGGYAQYTLIHQRWLVKNDTGLPAEELATVPLVLVTAMHTVSTLGQAGPGTRVLVHAGASGSGSMAIQVAKALGASVITTVSTPRKAELARRLGADEVIDYRQRNFADAVMEWTRGDGVDLVIDNLGGTAMSDNLRAARWGGRIINYGLVAGLETTLPNIYEFFRGQYQLLGSFMGTLEELEQGLQLVKARKVKPVLDEALPLGKVREAHARIDKHEVAGSLVLLPWA
ncbi:zinc-binding dehydrogenase [Betaproteobacteria bacterium SCN2]|jgi:NADPH:quinone reductase-like Zn-dependent oxidoreductase|nr:zinc-binding dehydrogenase [Betaproteobacteria bacterium SCN2]